MSGPARGYTITHPPFEEGNSAAVKHGAHSKRNVQPLADRLAAELLAERPWLASHRRSVDAWATVQAQYQLYLERFDDIGFFDSDGEERPGVYRLDRLAARAQSLRSDLAEPPLALARLIATMSSAAGQPNHEEQMAALVAEGKAIVAAWGLQPSQSLPAAPGVAEQPEDRA